MMIPVKNMPHDDPREPIDTAVAAHTPGESSLFCKYKHVFIMLNYLLP